MEDGEQSASRLPKIPIGVPTGDIEIVPHVSVIDGKEPFTLGLAGDIVLAGEDLLYRIIPMAIISRPAQEGDGRDYITVTASEANPFDAKGAMSQLAELGAENKQPESWKLLVSAKEMSFDAAFEAARPLRVAVRDPISVDLRFEVTLSGGTDVVTTEPFRGVVAISSDDRDPSGEPGPEGGFIFDCHSHWYGIPAWPKGQWTLCHGPCKVGSCVTVWNNKEWDNGWCFCTCD